ncbi:hypothetical protein KM043_006826 [Ampulex compressa]|nr:hypothetical protein KM043_006826 [Ampulex compressa]
MQPSPAQYPGTTGAPSVKLALDRVAGNEDGFIGKNKARACTTSRGVPCKVKSGLNRTPTNGNNAGQVPDEPSSSYLGYPASESGYFQAPYPIRGGSLDRRGCQSNDREELAKQIAGMNEIETRSDWLRLSFTAIDFSYGKNKTVSGKPPV